MAENVGANEVKPSSAKVHERGRALPAMGTASALAEDTAGIELTGKAEKATATKSEALISAAQNKVVRGCEVEMPPQEGKREGASPPQKGKRTYEPPPKAVLQKSKLKLAQTGAEREPKVKEPARKQGPELEALLQCVSATWTRRCSAVRAGTCSRACRSQTREAQAHRVGHQGG